MSWHQLSLRADSPQLAEDLSDWLQDRGALAVTLLDSGEQPLFEPAPGQQPLWPGVEVQALFEEPPDVDELLASLCRELGLDEPPDWQMETVADRDWERAWLDDFQPMRFGRRLWIVPSAYPEALNGDGVRIRLDPGLAFGTGTHATTALCLEWLDACLQPGQKLLDYGCGSGILAIAAARLGAERVWGVDIDPQALDASRENARANGVTQRLELSLARDFTPPAGIDVLMANILANPLQELAASFAQWLGPGARVVLSGILTEQAMAVSRAYAPWFAMAEPVSQENWVLLEGRRL